jgi:hypothetical protein
VSQLVEYAQYSHVAGQFVFVTFLAPGPHSVLHGPNSTTQYKEVHELESCQTQHVSFTGSEHVPLGCSEDEQYGLHAPVRHSGFGEGDVEGY